MTEAFLDAIDGDLAGFLLEFGEAAIYSHDLDDPYEVTCIFDSAHELVTTNEQDFDGEATWLRITSNDCPDLDYDDTFEVRGIVYTVTGIEPDGTGQTVVRLRAP